ncbi:hypothetical protein COCON_G00194330 [Conger conger]|uniref:Fibronectin type-III domain-containing protein n=1 Tax=Conger conger TaxID=82655 RepID=A0A9Q1D1H4_CONCO|nr:hypothetical protein COCON_G00194330 [Conger conger]
MFNLKRDFTSVTCTKTVEEVGNEGQWEKTIQVMKYILFTIHFIHQCYLGLGALPAPVNVTIDSLNFEPILRWEPGPGTPPGTAYRVKYSCYGRRLWLEPSFLNSTVTMLNLTGTFKKPKNPYAIHVRALNAGLKSPWSSQLFCPYRDTVLGPPLVSATGHGDRLLLNVTLPRGRADESIQEIYDKVSFSIFWKEAGESKEHKVITTQSEHVINHLHQGVEYCVMVQPEIIENPNLLSSDWTCCFTSPLPLSPVPITLAFVSVILILGGTALLGLIYTGFLCRLNNRVPNALRMSLARSYVLTVDATVPDRVSVMPGTGDAAEGGDEDEEEATGNGGYESRAGGFSEAGCSRSGGTVTPLAAGTSSERAITGPGLSEQIQEEGEEGDEGCRADINLLSVALGAQDVEEEEGGDEGWAAELQLRDGGGEHQPLLSLETGSGSRPVKHGSLQADDTALSHSPRLPAQSERGKTHSCHLRLHPEDSRQIDTQSALEEEEEEAEEGGGR